MNDGKAPCSVEEVDGVLGCERRRVLTHGVGGPIHKGGNGIVTALKGSKASFILPWEANT